MDDRPPSLSPDDSSLHDSVDIETTESSSTPHPHLHSHPLATPHPPEEMTSVIDSLSPFKTAPDRADAADPAPRPEDGCADPASRMSALGHVGQLYTIEAILGLNHHNSSGIIFNSIKY